uniref:Uncharacterized protein n=1 Tax=Candidatus Kentrum sp. SD TaxID=2126332 RepID=A0A450YXU2_9GAMM|nr:MAG: hypothetical protein BECKSD772F_GA0070984_12192 [Candidatus Kentron sp. SD]VFK46269.1 MAG: hypothetical protein BECKSD772E_GA0070983_10702 [Candidatus Kentron sp. SD]VFK79970.1 MAG: hypothetical protein BECKSD772D_GA0070982_10772 [Candidatus Kentron sp. SD]
MALAFGKVIDEFTFRKNKDPEQTGAHAKVHPLSASARSANIFMSSAKDSRDNFSHVESNPGRHR